MFLYGPGTFEYGAKSIMNARVTTRTSGANTSNRLRKGRTRPLHLMIGFSGILVPPAGIFQITIVSNARTKK